MKSEKRVVHKPTLPPFTCIHCGYSWYGYVSLREGLPNLILCTRCYNAAITALFKVFPRFYDDEGHTLPEVTAAWLAWTHDPTKKPLPRGEGRRFHQSVPQWIRQALTSGQMVPNGDLVYTITMRDNEIVSIEATEDRGQLKRSKKMW